MGQLLLGRRKLESTVRYLGIEVDAPQRFQRKSNSECTVACPRLAGLDTPRRRRLLGSVRPAGDASSPEAPRPVDIAATTFTTGTRTRTGAT